MHRKAKSGYQCSAPTHIESTEMSNVKSECNINASLVSLPRQFKFKAKTGVIYSVPGIRQYRVCVFYNGGYIKKRGNDSAVIRRGDRMHDWSNKHA